MINFRYHIVSLMAVFLALAVGIAAGVSIGPSVEKGLADQAAQDRNQVTELRAEIQRRNAVDTYRQEYEKQAGSVITTNVLAGVRVAVVSMPGSVDAVGDSVEAAVTGAGGVVVREVQVADDVFDPQQEGTLTATLAEEAPAALNFPADLAPVGRFGMALAHAIADPRVETRDSEAVALSESLNKSGLATISDDSTQFADLVIVLTAPATDPVTAPEVMGGHVQVDVALRDRAAVVVAGPNSTAIDGTEVLALRSDSGASTRLTTVDVADLSSGVTTVVLAGKEQILGRTVHHYGAMSKADATAPVLPVR